MKIKATSKNPKTLDVTVDIQPAEPLNLRQRAAERSKREILLAAAEEFASHGLTGARVDAISEKTRTTKAMIYYYFGSKEAMYAEVLEEVYNSIRRSEDGIRVEPTTDAEELLTAYIENTFDFHEKYPLFSRIISIENINNASTLRESTRIRGINRSVIDKLGQILALGVATGQFRKDVTASELHYLISALCIYRMTNRLTFGMLFNVDFASTRVRNRQRRLAVESVLSMLKSRLD
ncbi:MAG: TetR/AcrR family transcriptional regulator [Polaromonas sp.]